MKNKQRVLTQILIVTVIILTIWLIIAIIVPNNNDGFGNIVYKKHEKSNTLVTVQVVFRHGSRTPDPGTLYPLDPYYNYSYYPENYGEITTKGRKGSFLVGQLLRQKYGNFLGGSDYYPGIVKSFVSGYDRTQMSLQCVLAGLFPNEQSVFGIPWRPITYDIFDVDEDVYIGLMANCKSMRFPENEANNSEIEKLYEFLTEKTGQKFTKVKDLLGLTSTLLVESDYGLELPSWAKSVFPNPLVAIQEHKWMQFAQLNLRFSASGLLKMITEHALDVISKEEVQNLGDDYAKIVLYSGHDYNVYFLRYCLNPGLMEIPGFSAYLVFELHKVDGKYGFKIFYNNYKEGHPIQLIVPFCEDSYDGLFCSMDTFIKNTKWFYDPLPSCP